MELLLAPLHTAPAPRSHTPLVTEMVMMAIWQEALRGRSRLAPAPAAEPVVAKSAMTTPTLITAPPKPEPRPSARKWERALSLFRATDKADHIKLDQHAWDDEFKVDGEWNTRPSRVETFLSRYDKNQTLTTLAVVALLLLWIF